MQTLNLEQAAEFLKIHPETLKLKANSGEIPGAKIGRAWVFIDEDLAECIRNKYNGKRDARQGENERCQKSQFSSAKIAHITGTGSQRQVDSEYDNLLKPATKRKPKK